MLTKQIQNRLGIKLAASVEIENSYKLLNDAYCSLARSFHHKVNVDRYSISLEEYEEAKELEEKIIELENLMNQEN